MSLYRIAAPVIMLGVVAAVGIVVFAEGVVSVANERYRTVFNAWVTKAPEMQPVESVFFQGPSPEGNALYYARRYNPTTQTLEGAAGGRTRERLLRSGTTGWRARQAAPCSRSSASRSAFVRTGRGPASGWV